VYALGLVLYEMLAGRPAYQGDSEMATALARLTGPPPPIGSIRSDVSPALVAVIDHALQPDPAHRIPSAAAFGELLERGPAPAPARPKPAATAPVAQAAPRPRPAEPTRTQARPKPAPAKRRRGRGLRVLAFLVFLAALGVAAALLTARIVDDGNGGGNGSGNGGESGGAPTNAFGASPTISDFDPFGDNGHENPDEVVFAVDGLQNTAWRSETYNTRDFGNAKPGVGLVLHLPTETDVSAVQIDANAGYDVEIFVANEPSDTLDGWGKARAKQTNLPANATIEVSPSATGRYVLVWFTLLPESRRLDVSEIRVV